ncbi:glycosyltransferase [bacterium]|nr:glycosyltransferase [bacterium]
MSSPAPSHVLHVTFDMRIGGTEQVIRNLIEASDVEHTRMSIFCIEEPLGPWGEDLRLAGVDIASYARRAGLDLRLILALRRHLKEHDVDVLHCHQYTPWVYGAFAGAGTRAKVIFTEHGRFHPDSASAKRRYVNPILAWLTQSITAISAATRQALIDYEYLSAEKISVIYNGIRPLTPDPTAALALREELGIPKDATVLGSIARFDPIKNHQMMLKAFRLIVDVHPKSRLLLVGDGEERTAIEAEIDALDLSENVILPGYISQPAVWLEAMDVFLLSSFSEGTSMTLLEAMSLGKPCVVTDVGGNPEIILNGKTGLVTPSDNRGLFAAAINHLIEDPALHKEMATRARERFEQSFTSSAMAHRYRDAYDTFSKT